MQLHYGVECKMCTNFKNISIRGEFIGTVSKITLLLPRVYILFSCNGCTWYTNEYI